MQYFVTGATGLIGSHLVTALVDDGHDVIALTRDRSKATHLPDHATIVEGDITIPATIRDAMTGVDGVFHTAAWAHVGPGPWNVDTAERINVAGTRNVLELVDDLAIPNAVYTSSIGVYGSTWEHPIDESIRYDGAIGNVYHRTKWQAHYDVAEPMMADGLPLVIVTPAGVFGRWDKPTGSVRGAFRDYLQGDLPFIPQDFYRPWEYAADTARNHIRAMEHGTPGEEYFITGESRTLASVFDLAEAITGVPAPRTVPPTVFRVLAAVIDVTERVWRPPEGFESERLRLLAGANLEVDTTKARQDFGLSHRQFEDGFRTYLDWERDQLDMAT